MDEQTNSSRKMISLLWKCLHTRRKDYKKTLIILFSPLFLIIIGVLIKSKISISNYADLASHETQPLSYSNLLEFSEINGVFYTTNNSIFVNSLMSIIANKLIYTDSVIGYTNEEELLKTNLKLLQNDKRYLAVIFNDVDNDIPSKLNYTIRSSEKYLTSKVKPDVIVSGPHEQYGQIYERFTSLQIAIDTTFIEMKSKKNITKDISIQPFPYPPFKKCEDQSIKFSYFLPFSALNSFMILGIIIIGELIKEKKSGIENLVSMMGMNRNLIWISHYISYLLPGVVITIVYVLLLKLGPDALVPESNFFIMWFSMFLQLNYIILLSIMLTKFLSEELMASIVLLVIWTASNILFVQYSNYWISLFFPNLAILWMFKLIGFFEYQEIGITFDTILTTPYSLQINYLSLLLGLIFQSVICAIVIWIMELQNSPITVLKAYFKNLFKKITLTRQAILDEQPSRVCIEGNISNSKVGIKIDGVSKVFKHFDGYKKCALSDVTLDIYEGNITVLLGHNGAGKTTLLSIISGMLPATDGNVYINGNNTRTHRDSVINLFGICPQDSVTFPELTVQQNIMFFAMVKGFSIKQAREETKKNMERLYLTDKKNEYCCNLSGGTQRRLQLAMALAGGSTIIILDEPTTGLDPSNRREIWDILLELRKSHTILLTTHFMEEADALGDYIAIIDKGKLKCYGTPMYLKNKICPGYKLTLLKDQMFVPRISAGSIQTILGKYYDILTTLTDETEYKLEFLINTNNTNTIKEFFTCNEKNLRENGVLSLSLRQQSIEDVFLQICTVDSTHCEEDVIGDIEHTSSGFKTFNNMCTLIYKNILFQKYKTYLWIPQVLLLVLFCLIVTFSIHESKIDNSINGKIKLDMELYSTTKQHILFSKFDKVKNDSNMEAFINWKNVEFNYVHKNIYNAVLNAGRADNTRYYTDLPIALSLDLNDYTGFYSTSIFHTLPVVVNLVTNIIASEVLGSDDTSYIHVYNDPINDDSMRSKLHFPTRSIGMILFWASLMGMAWNVLMTIFIAYPLSENLSGARNLILMTGVSKVLYWFSNYFWDMLRLIVILMFTIVVLSFDPFHIMTTEPLLHLGIGLLFNIMGVLSFIYVTSYCWSSSTSGFIYFFILGLFSFVMSITKYLQITSNYECIFIPFMNYFLAIIIPTINMDTLFFNVMHISQDRYICIKRHELLIQNNQSLNDAICCGRDEITGECVGLTNFYTDPDFGILYNLVQSIIGTCIYMSIICIIETNNLRLKNKVKNDKSCDENDTPLSINEITKSYKNGMLCRTITIDAIKSFNCVIKKGECFGLIGLNGAGKSSTFKILTGIENPTSGYISIFGNKLRNDYSKQLPLIGYCPQVDSVGDYLTAREALTIFCEIRGVSKKYKKELVEKTLRGFGLHSQADVRSCYCSGGYKRALSLAIAMIGLKSHNENGNILLLDEPTSGVDPMSRKLIHRRISDQKKYGKSILLSSHSMGECEKLCDRLGIMIEGELKHTDVAEKLKKEHDSGYIISIKLKMPASTCYDEVDGRGDIPSLKETVQQKIGPIMQDHKSHLQLNAEDRNLTYGDLFIMMEDISKIFRECIEHYTICETSLEMVFLNCVQKYTKKEKKNA